MHKLSIFLLVMLLGIIVLIPAQSASAVGPYTPIADAYTLVNDPDTNTGEDDYLLLSASNLDGCVPTSYVWFKFQVPNPTTTISYATLSVPIDAIYSGNESLDMELRSSSDTDWQESSITWSNQPDLDAEVLAIAPSTAAPSDALFTSAALAGYLNARKGQTVSLVVKANCNGNVYSEATRVIAARENTTANKVELVLQGPTNINLLDMKANSRTQDRQIVALGVFVGIISAYFLVKKSSFG